MMIIIIIVMKILPSVLDMIGWPLSGLDKLQVL